MPALDALARTLDELIDDGSIAGWAAGVADDAGQVVRTGGLRTLEGQGMSEDTQLVLSSSTKPMAGALAMRLVELDVIDLDEPVDPWLPELAQPRVLVSPEADLTATVPADRPITLRHLLTMTPGFGWVSEPGPLAEVMGERGLQPGPWGPQMSPDEFMGRLGSLPLANHPGTAWRYHTSSEALAVLLARASGRTVPELLDEHLLRPLGLTGTTFTGDPDRMATPLAPSATGGLAPFELPVGTYVAEPEFPSLATGLVSTVGDQLTFLRSLVGGPGVLTPGSVAAMRSDALTDEQRSTATGFIGPDCGWGLHVEVRPDCLIGWAGGMGTIGYADPRTGRAAFLATQVTVGAPGTTTAFDHFWSLFD
ncbi:serine hydrolase domain-containing protein [Janibacter limosus]|uniref:Class A beta-lactamase-related serine hydrolase n=1 Tax=Janibacter limosus TaxID=53458 RepID=A0A4P6MUF8_9MICO|nr:serine hydrolase domain-containing protein [Janibacter limosus]QBF45435.1 class A beta-lactamase-related serine hydrolase [Janibacter limosus]